MMRALGALARPVLMRLAPETAHRATIAALKLAPPLRPRPPDPRLAVSAFGLEFSNPLGMAAGFDKNAEVVGALLALGFGHVEVGTLTPRPQPGNPRPRLFRLPADRALVNRLGFNNRGYEAARARLAAGRIEGVVGVNVGPNRDASDRLADFALGVKTFAPFASYVAINISSPNTPRLRDLQRRDALDELVARVVGARDETAPRRPVLIKIAPDLDLRALDDVVAVCAARGVDGLIVANTTTARPPSLRDADAREAGGLSGRPLFAPSTRILARTFLRCGGAFQLIGCGGVEDAQSALAKIEAGASLVQLYTALIYRGPGLIDEILDGLSRALAARGAGGLADLVGVGAREWAVSTG
ncbi:MAG: quinone-dependent dihydroorotate dehydrogenase [Roseiarcus sp.]|jgi:dihydroorotate dehydrogenase